MKRKSPERPKVEHLFPPPKIDYWKRNASDTGIETSVTVPYRDAKRQKQEVTFLFVIVDAVKGHFKNRLDLVATHGARPTADKELGDLRRKAKDTLVDFYNEYKREPRVKKPKH